MDDEEQSRPVSINLDENRPEGATSWELPAWGHDLSFGVYPLHMLIDDRFIPLGTAFSISTGIVATATHNFIEAFKHHPRGRQILEKDSFPKNLHLKEIGDPGF